jgi:PKD repeat protein
MRKVLVITLIALVISVMLSPLFSSSLTAIAKTDKPTVSFSTTSYTASALNEVFTISISISNVKNLWAWTADVAWDPTCLSISDEGVEEGDFLSQSGTYKTLFIAPVNNAQGIIKGGISSAILTTDSVSGDGVLATLQFKVLKQCVQEPIQLGNLTLRAPYNGVTSELAKDIEATSTSSTFLVTLKIPGKPTADAGKDQAVAEHSTVTLNASKTITTGEEPTYTWTFTDGEQKTLTGQIATYTFNSRGTYVVTLTVHDSYGDGTATVTITVKDTTPPIAVIKYQGQPVTQPIAIDLNQTITLDGSASHDDAGTISEYRWLKDDYNQPPYGTDVTVDIRFGTSGTYSVTLTVKDADGNNGNATVTINVGDVDLSQTPMPNDPGATDNPSNTGAPSRTNLPNMGQDYMSLPPTILGILIIVTIVVLTGSGFWLRRNCG